MHKYASTLKVEELEEETRSGEGQTEVGERDCTVRQIFFSCTELGVANALYTWTRIDKFSQVAHLAHIRRKDPHDLTRA